VPARSTFLLVFPSLDPVDELVDRERLGFFALFGEQLAKRLGELRGDVFGFTLRDALTENVGRRAGRRVRSIARIQLRAPLDGVEKFVFLHGD
jgi:hypothetical protein